MYTPWSFTHRERFTSFVAPTLYDRHVSTAFLFFTVIYFCFPASCQTLEIPSQFFQRVHQRIAKFRTPTWSLLRCNDHAVAILFKYVPWKLNTWFEHHIGSVHLRTPRENWSSTDSPTHESSFVRQLQSRYHFSSKFLRVQSAPLSNAVLPRLRFSRSLSNRSISVSKPGCASTHNYPARFQRNLRFYSAPRSF